MTKVRLRLLHIVVSLPTILMLALLFPLNGTAQTVDETVKFIGEMANTHGFVRALSCRNPKAPKPTKMTEIYTVIPTGAKFGLVELNHGHDEVMTGFTQFDLHDIESVEYQGQQAQEGPVALYGVRLVCKATGPCILKTSYCSGAVSNLEAQFPDDTLLFRSASHAERVAKALAHLLSLVRAEKSTSPF
ncbi:MAG: hypothetical protein KF814_10270 [Nitrospiraceae bacterium]|nr:hypothetical protein [Nitrospiraceae bacterium]